MVMKKIPTFQEIKDWVNNNADVPNADTVDGQHAEDLKSSLSISSPQNVAATRSRETKYTNDNGCPLFVTISNPETSYSSAGGELRIDGATVSEVDIDDNVTSFTIQGIVPRGSSYELIGGFSFDVWIEQEMSF